MRALHTITARTALAIIAVTYLAGWALSVSAQNEQPTQTAPQGSLEQRVGYWKEAFAPEFLSNWILAGIGLAGIVVATFTLHKLVQQTRAAVDAAYAAKSSADAATASLATTRALERARFTIQNRKIHTLANPPRLRVEYEAINRGRSVAAVKRSAHHMFIAPTLPDPPQFPPLEHGPEIVQAGEPMVLEHVLHSLPQEWKDGFEKRTSFLHIIGLIEYDDIFGQTHLRGYAFTFDADAEVFHPPQKDPGYNYES